MNELQSWWNDVGNNFFNQPWARWVAFLVLALSVLYIWTWGVKRIFG